MLDATGTETTRTVGQVIQVHTEEMLLVPELFIEAMIDNGLL